MDGQFSDVLNVIDKKIEVIKTDVGDIKTDIAVIKEQHKQVNQILFGAQGNNGLCKKVDILENKVVRYSAYATAGGGIIVGIMKLLKII
jgi:hypothetical protein